MTKPSGFFQAGLFCAAMMAVPGVTSAQVELSGGWGARQHEDVPDRNAGPRVGEYQGLPINEASRARGEAWSAGIWTVPEHQCIPHPSDYGSNVSNLVVWHDMNPTTGEILAYHTQMQWMTPVRTIWMDGRPHPSEFAPHTYMGFSTGKWEGDTLTVTTTHLKTGYIRRNGIARTENATVYERLIRNGDFLTWITIIDDPELLTEPYIKSRNFVYEPGLHSGLYPCSVDVEIPGDQTKIPHYLFGANPYLNEMAAENGIPEEARAGGALTMYPEYVDRLRTLPAAAHKPVVVPEAIIIRPSANGQPAPRGNTKPAVTPAPARPAQ